MTRSFVLMALLLAAGVSFAGVPSAMAASGQSTASAASLSPLGFKIFCIRNPQQCVGGGAASLPFDDGMLSTIKQVNLAVNRSIRPRNDPNGKDVWTLNPASGDCEDYVVSKRARLIQKGLSPSALRIAYAKTRSGAGHAVLIVRTSKGDFVLDSLTNAIKPMAQSNLRFISMSGSNPKSWTAI